ncbi:MAG: transglutaminase domain-containing protein [Actinobacteria bacterium]|nr:transglutaminase domain-containing protein [Actinomycetota bacterium]
MQLREQSSLAFYAQPAAMTSAGSYAPLLEPLPGDVAGLAAVAHGLLIHEHLAHAYGVTLTEQDRASVHIRPAEQLLAQIAARDDRPLAAAREPSARLPGNCRQFTVLLTAMLRAKGRPARARCGFGGYFGTGMFEDHWVCEYWHEAGQRWVLADAQIDDRQRELFPIDFDVTDVPRDRFLVAGQAWQLSRSGAADPARFGLSMAGEAGDWWIAGNLMRDAAALRNTELLPWDCWGAMPGPVGQIGADLAAFFDRLAVLTQDPDAASAELERLCETDDRLRVPPVVRNEVRRRDEPLTG